MPRATLHRKISAPVALHSEGFWSSFKMTPNESRSTRSTVLTFCALLASSTLLFFGTGPHPVCWLTWLAPRPVLPLPAHSPALPTFGIASLSWFIGCLNMWDYFRGLG